jgi:hypothetical protein
LQFQIPAVGIAQALLRDMQLYYNILMRKASSIARLI